MPDLMQEEALTLNQARALCPSRPDISTIWRWATGAGCRGVVLESFVFAGRRYTTRQALLRFQERTEAAATGAARTPRPRKRSRTRQRQIADAERRNKRRGL